MVSFLNFHIPRVFVKIQVIMAPYNIQFNYVERKKITVFDNATKWPNKTIGCFKSSYEDDPYKDITQVV